MNCQEIAFARGTCRLTIEDASGRPTEARFVARIAVVSEDHATSRPLVFDDGTPVEIHGSSEAAVAANAIGFCQQHFGALSEQMHACVDFGRPPADEPPLTMSQLASNVD